MLFYKSEIYKESVLKFIIQWNVGYFQEGFNFIQMSSPELAFPWNYEIIVL